MKPGRIGMTDGQIFFRVVLLQVNIVPPMGNEIITP